MADWIEVAKVDAIGPRGLEVQLGEEPVLLVRKGSEVFALHGICSHQDMELAGGYAEGPAWVCPHHGAKFDLKSGEAAGMPAVEGIPVYPVRVEGGVVFLREPA